MLNSCLLSEPVLKFKGKKSQHPDELQHGTSLKTTLLQLKMNYIASKEQVKFLVTH